MPSPFSGIDPYVEAPELWPDFHWSLAVEARAWINERVPPGYVARLAHHRPRHEEAIPLLLSIEVLTLPQRAVVTFIEILSPLHNDPLTEVSRDYQRQRQELLRAPVHLLEINLFRQSVGGSGEQEMGTPYQALLTRNGGCARTEVWPLHLSEPLPVLPVPLLEPDPDVPLDLGACVASVYERGAYASQIDYSKPTLPPLSAADTEAVRRTLAQHRAAR